MKLNIKKFLSNKEVKNSGWIIGEKLLRMIISLFVGIYTARFLGPSNFGLINYAAAYTAFFMSFCTLGINSVIIKNFADHPEEEGLTIGTTIVIRGLSSILAAISIVGIVFVVDAGEPTTICVCALSSISLVFHVLDTIYYWFQSRYLSKITSIATFVAYIAVVIYRIILLSTKASVTYFALANSIDYIIIGIFLYTSYRKHNGPKLGFSWKKAGELLSVSYHFILSGIMVSIYGQTDKIMLKQMMGDTEVGFYSTAVGLCNMWVFVLSAIIQSIVPTIIRYSKENEELFNRKNRQLYMIVFYLSFLASLFFTFFSGIVIRILYGQEYLGAVTPLRIITWYTAFSYLGVARDTWIVCKGHQKYVKYMYLSAAIINIGLNLLFIPLMQAAGAALASLITQICTSIILPFFIKALRPNAILILQAITFYDFRKKRQLLGDK